MDLLPAYGRQFFGIKAQWFAILRLDRVSGNALEGRLSDLRATSSYPAILENPESLDVIFSAEAAVALALLPGGLVNLFHGRNPSFLNYYNSRCEPFVIAHPALLLPSC